ncbi:helicase-associated domain-containing protein [Paenibacillus solisilvae]|uniref:Helicase-associated domain-containing protein n=1 Tax=Paenibacillus solisilvae TaxID=2486751 RepID=A0ABW0W298_9BACL
MIVEEIEKRMNPADKQKFEKSSVWCHPPDEMDENKMSAAQWPACLLSEPHLRAAWEKLPKTASQALAVVISSFGAAPFKEEQLLQSVPAGSIGVNYRLGLLRLLQSGIIFAVRKGWGEKLYFVPQDTFLLWYRIIYSDSVCLPVENLKVHDIVPNEEDEGYTPPFRLQLLHTMAAIKRTDMRLTSKGILTKRTVDRCLKQLKTTFAEKKALRISEDMISGYPLSVAFALEIIFSHGWLVKQQESLQIQEYWNNWLMMPTITRETELVHRIFRQFAFQHIPSGQAAALLSELLPMKWYRLADLGDSLRSIIADIDRAEAAAAAVDDYCRWLSSLGWLETAQTKQGHKIIRWLITVKIRIPNVDFLVNFSEGTDLERIRITPDGEIFVDSNGPDHVRWLLELIAERKQTDRVTVYKMNAHSLSFAQKEGISGERIIELLEQASGERLPETVRLSIMEGMPREPVQIQPPQTAQPKQAIPSLFPDPNSLYGFELLTDWPSYRSLFDGLDEVPNMWIKQLRPYHHTTRRELLERALSWRTAVKLTYQGAVQAFVPERIEEAGTAWSVVGHFVQRTDREPVRLSPEMWGEMMLDIPQESNMLQA